VSTYSFSFLTWLHIVNTKKKKELVVKIKRWKNLIRR
jgi:hypothetical protein